jgi:cytochrome P450
MKELGINRCLGAHLSLTEAAAAAGVALEALLRILKARPRADT